MCEYNTRVSSMMISVAVSILSSNFINCESQSIALFCTEGCNDDASCRYFEASGIFGCHGTFSGGMDDSSVDNICGSNYHVCDGAIETKTLGLTISQCEALNDDEIFFIRESSHGSALCDSVHGSSNSEQHGSNDVWACSGAPSDMLNADCLKISIHPWLSGRPCYEMTHICGAFGGNHEDLTMGSDTLNEYNNIALNDKNRGGVLCCPNAVYNVPTDAPTDAPTFSPTKSPTKVPTSPIVPTVDPHMCCGCLEEYIEGPGNLDYICASQACRNHVCSTVGEWCCTQSWSGECIDAAYTYCPQ